MKKHRCPCCGFYTLEDCGEYSICPVCFWEDDPYQQQNPDYESGANNTSLNAAIENYRKIGVSEARFKYNVRPPYDEEKLPSEDK